MSHFFLRHMILEVNIKHVLSDIYQQAVCPYRMGVAADYRLNAVDTRTIMH